MYKCACGQKIEGRELNAVKVYDKRGRLVRVVCPDCAIRGPKRSTKYRRKFIYYKKYREYPLLPGDIEL